MQLGYLFIISGFMIMVGCLGIMLMFMVEENMTATKTMLTSMGIGLMITCFNLITFPPQAEQAKIYAYLLGLIAIVGFFLNKKKYVLIAKCMISLSIILGLTQLILYH